MKKTDCEYNDRLIFCRDGELRKNSTWMFSIPDKFGRTDGIGYNAENEYDGAGHNPGINEIDTASIGIAVARIRGLGEAKPFDDQPSDDQPLDDQPSDDEPILLGSKTTDYVGNKIYIDGLLDKILLGNGYIRDNKYHFYLRDHLGNNRVVLQSHTLAVEDPGDITIDPLDEPGTGFEFSVVYPIVVQRINYYPSGVMMPGGLNPEEQKFTYTGHEFDSMHGLNWLDAGARFFDAAIMRWHVPDGKSEKYVWTSPYNYAMNNPLKFIDPDGKEVIAVTGLAQQMILNTLPHEIWGYVVFNENGKLDASVLNTANSTSGNVAALSQIANDSKIYEVNIDNKFTWKDENGTIDDRHMNPVTIITDMPKGVLGYNTNEFGFMGVCQTPGNAPEKFNSIDDKIRITINSSLSEAGMAQTFSEEAYGHAFLYSKGEVHTHIFNGSKDLNQLLVNSIKNAIEETIRNMQNQIDEMLDFLNQMFLNSLGGSGGGE